MMEAKDLGSGQCELHSQGRIIWNVDAEENGLFMPYRNLSGKLSVEENKYRCIANDIQLVLSYPRDLGCLLSDNCAEMKCLLMNKVWLPKGRPAQLYPCVLTQTYLAMQFTSLSTTITHNINFILSHQCIAYHQVESAYPCCQVPA